MPPVLIDGDKQCVVRLEGEIDISSAEELKAMLVAAISSRKELQINLEATTDLDVTAIQLLCSAALEAEKTGRSLRVVHLPESVRNNVREMGFDDFPAPGTGAIADADDR